MTLTSGQILTLTFQGHIIHGLTRLDEINTMVSKELLYRDLLKKMLTTNYFSENENIFNVTCSVRSTVDLTRSDRTPLYSEHPKQYDGLCCEALSHSERKRRGGYNNPSCAVADGEKTCAGEG